MKAETEELQCRADVETNVDKGEKIKLNVNFLGFVKPQHPEGEFLSKFALRTILPEVSKRSQIKRAAGCCQELSGQAADGEGDAGITWRNKEPSEIPLSRNLSHLHLSSGSPCGNQGFQLPCAHPELPEQCGLALSGLKPPGI